MSNSNPEKNRAILQSVWGRKNAGMGEPVGVVNRSSQAKEIYV
jgi:hypothetical protein